MKIDDSADMSGSSSTEARLRNLENAIKGQAMTNTSFDKRLESLERHISIDRDQITISEQIPDNLPEWADRAMANGNFFETAIALVTGRDRLLKQREELLNAMGLAWDYTASPKDILHEIKLVTQDYGWCVSCNKYHDGVYCDGT